MASRDEISQSTAADSAGTDSTMLPSSATTVEPVRTSPAAYTAAKQLQVGGNKCLDANGNGTANGTKLILWTCNGQQNQRWTPRS